MHSVVDILGLHPISRAIFDNAAAAIVGMARDGGGAVGDLGERTVGVTMLGQTTPGVMVLREKLLEAGHAPVIFHANGVGGPGDGEARRRRRARRDHRLHALRARELADGRRARDRPGAAARGRAAAGCRSSSSPAAATSSTRARRTRSPSASAAARATTTTPSPRSCGSRAEEGVELGRMIADRLSESTGPVHVIAPTRGFSLADAEGGDLWDPEADRAFLDALRDALRARLRLRGGRRARRRPGVRRARGRALPEPREGAGLMVLERIANTVPPALRRAQILQRIQREGGVSAWPSSRATTRSPRSRSTATSRSSRARGWWSACTAAPARSTPAPGGAAPAIPTAWTQRFMQAGTAKDQIAAARPPLHHAGRDGLPRRVVLLPRARAAADGRPAERDHARDELAGDRLRGPGGDDARRRLPGRARPAHAHAGRAAGPSSSSRSSTSPWPSSRPPGSRSTRA